MTPPEVALWQALRSRQLNARFRRQHPIGPWIVDFYCTERRLALEVDGWSHNVGDPARDGGGTRTLHGEGSGCCGSPLRMS